MAGSHDDNLKKKKERHIFFYLQIKDLENRSDDYPFSNGRASGIKHT
jgi:hypothetical protein